MFVKLKLIKIISDSMHFSNRWLQYFGTYTFMYLISEIFRIFIKRNIVDIVKFQCKIFLINISGFTPAKRSWVREIDEKVEIDERSTYTINLSLSVCTKRHFKGFGKTFTFSFSLQYVDAQNNRRETKYFLMHYDRSQ